MLLPKPKLQEKSEEDEASPVSPFSGGRFSSIFFVSQLLHTSNVEFLPLRTQGSAEFDRHVT